MKSYQKTTKNLLILTLLACFCAVLDAADWPNWRGVNYDGISAEKDWDPLKIKDGVKPLWKKSIGIGFSTTSVSDGLAYAMGNTGVKGEDESKHNDIVFCFDAETGREVWRHTYPQPLDPKYYEGGTLASPIVVSGRVYTLSKDGLAFCLDAKTGDEIWQKDLAKELGIKRTTWGHSGSPVVIDNMVIYNASSTGVALNKNDGSLIWQGPGEPGGYATAMPFTSGDKKCIAMFSFSDIIVMDAATGEELWRYPWKTKHDVNAADPIIVGNKMFISSGYGVGCALIKVENGKVVELWRNKNMRNKMNASVLWKDYIYGVDEGGELRCLSFATGQMAWAQKGFGQGSLMVADGKLIILGEKGNLVIAEATPDGYKVISEAKILSPRCWSVPVLANGRIYARNAGGDMVCLDVSKQAAVKSSPGKNWPQWQGPNRDNRSTETGLLKKWPKQGPQLLWSMDELEAGYSTVSIVDGTIYITGTIDKEGVLFALDMAGKLKWKEPYGSLWTKSFPSARCTPTVDDGNVYVISSRCVVTCFDAKSGHKKWDFDAFSEFQGQYGHWGLAESPLVFDNKVICTPGGKKATMVALDKKTGEIIWASESIGEKATYCSPILIERAGRNIIVTMLDNGIVGLEAETGQILWSDKFGKKAINPTTPIYKNGCIYTTSGYDDGGVMYNLSADGGKITRKWVDEVLDNHHGGVVEVDGYIYGSNWDGNSKGNWVCLEWETGKVMYETKWFIKGSLTYADGMLYCYNEKNGMVGLVKATPEKFEIISSFKVPLGTEQHWAHPVVYDGRLYIRHGNTLMAYDIKAK